MKKLSFVPVLLVMAFGLFSCGNNEKSTTDAAAAADTINEVDDYRFWKILADIPAPYALVDAMKEAGIKLDKNMLNNPANAANYTTSAQKGLNFGVYGFDLIALSAFEKGAEAGPYMEAVRQLATELDAAQGFEKFTAEYINSVIDNKDSMRHITNEIFTETSKYLTNNSRLETATFVAIGTYVESQYLATQTLKNLPRNAKTDFLFNKIYESRLELENILKLLEGMKDKPEFAEVTKALQDINAAMAEVKDSTMLDNKALANLASVLESARKVVVK